MALSWEELTAMAAAHRRREAAFTLRLMVAMQGDSESWNKLRDEAIAQLKHE